MVYLGSDGRYTIASGQVTRQWPLHIMTGMMMHSLTRRPTFAKPPSPLAIGGSDRKPRRFKDWASFEASAPPEPSLPSMQSVRVLCEENAYWPLSPGVLPTKEEVQTQATALYNEAVLQAKSDAMKKREMLGTQMMAMVMLAGVVLLATILLGFMVVTNIMRDDDAPIRIQTTQPQSGAAAASASQAP